MNRTPHLLTGRKLRAAACLLLAVLAAATTFARDQPNIILIVSDDQGFSDLGAFGGTEFVTPHLDRLAREGVRATSFYLTASVCTVSRSGLLTGRYPQRNGTYDMIRNDLVNYGYEYSELEYAISPEMTLGLDPREKTLGDVLKTAGYRNAVVGKWDMGQAKRFLPLQRGFDYFYGHGNNGIDYYTHARYGVHSMFRNNERTKDDLGMYATDLFRRESVQFIQDSRDGPFFLYLPFNAPHGASNLERDSYQVPEHYIQRYYPELDPSNNRTKYKAMISAMDEAIGEILAKLDEFGLTQNTLVIFFSDNGRNGSNLDGKPLRGGKGSPFEGGLRTPFIARWPAALPSGKVTDEFLSVLELMPTFAAIAGTWTPDAIMDGFNMLPVLQGKQPSPRTEMFWEWRGQQAVRSGDWKWVYHPGRRRPGADSPPPRPIEGLFNLRTDVSESNDLSARHPDILAQLKDRFALWRAEMDAAEPRGPFRDY